MSDFLAPRACFREPIPEIFRAAELLDRAVDAHLAGNRTRAARLIAAADMAEVREWVESVWGPASPEIHRVREVKGSPPTLDEADRDPRRKATREQKKALIARDGHRCRFCGIPVVRYQIRDRMRCYSELPWPTKGKGCDKRKHAAFLCLWMQFDHVLPHSRGGRTDLDNLVVTCGPCNWGRNDATLEEVGLADPRIRPVQRIAWDGLERFAG